MKDDIVRVFRILEYVGPRGWVEHTIKQSIHGTREFGKLKYINAATLGAYPEIIGKYTEVEDDPLSSPP